MRQSGNTLYNCRLSPSLFLLFTAGRFLERCRQEPLPLHDPDTGLTHDSRDIYAALQRAMGEHALAALVTSAASCTYALYYAGLEHLPADALPEAVRNTHQEITHALLDAYGLLPSAVAANLPITYN